MEFIPKDQIIDFVRGGSEENEEEEDSESSKSKLGGKDLVKNMGVMVVIAGAIALLILILGLMGCVLKRNKVANGVYQKI